MHHLQSEAAQQHQQQLSHDELCVSGHVCVGDVSCGQCSLLVSCRIEACVWVTLQQLRTHLVTGWLLTAAAAAAAHGSAGMGSAGAPSRAQGPIYPAQPECPAGCRTAQRVSFPAACAGMAAAVKSGMKVMLHVLCEIHRHVSHPRPAVLCWGLTDVFCPGLCMWQIASIRATVFCWLNVAPLTCVH